MLAVSGGADSLCLLQLFHEWRQRQDWSGTGHVVTVDHGIRTASREEAEFVGRICDNVGLQHRILTWNGDKPSSNRQAAARDARYRLISVAMEEAGAQALLLGHHLGDQAETFLDRLTRGSGVSGLSAMAVDEPDGPSGIRLLRPFLETPKARLKASLEERGMAWCEDPTNADHAYKRSRLRKIAVLLAEEGLSEQRIFDTAHNLRRCREALEDYCRREYRAKVIEHPAGPIKIALDDYAECPQEIRFRLLSEIIRQVTLESPQVRLSKLEACDAALMRGADFKITLAGAVVEQAGDAAWMWKEAGRRPPPVLENPAGGGTWDGRFRYSFPVGGSAVPLVLGPLSAAPVRMQSLEWPDGWPRAAFETSPAVWTAEGEMVRLPFGSAPETAEIRRELRVDVLRLPFSAAKDAPERSGAGAQMSAVRPEFRKNRGTF